MALRCILWCAVSSKSQNQEDKISLPIPEAEGRAIAKKHNWTVTDVMIVPGYSRRFIDFHDLRAAAAAEKIDAFDRLEKHWQDRDFDVLVVLDGNRLARTQSLHAYVVEKTIEAGAFLYSLRDGEINKHNHRMWISMNGYKSAGEIDHLVKARDDSMTARATRGLPVSSRIPMSHLLIRHKKTGEGVRLVVNEDRRRLWNDLATLILEGVAWDRMERELYTRYGHVDDDGKEFYSNFMYKLVMKPLFWGHIARRHNNPKAANGYKLGSWIYDENELVPLGALVFRNTHPPVWKGELAAMVKAELIRRTQMGVGKSSPESTHRFSGLIVCAGCGSFMSTHVSKKIYRGMRCPASTARLKYKGKPRCCNNKIMKERLIIEQMKVYLTQMIEQNTSEVFTEDPRPSLQDNIAGLEKEIQALEDQARGLISKQLTAGENLQKLYEEKLQELNEQLKHMKATCASLKLQGSAQVKETAVQQRTLAEIAELSVEKFFEQDSRYINQVLHRLMGRKRLLLQNGEIVGVAEVNKRQRRHT